MAISLLKGRLAQGAVGSFALQVAEAGLGFMTSLVLARLLGAAEYGAYAFAIAFASVLTIPAVLGYDTLSMKQGAALGALQAWSRLRAFVSGARRSVLVFSLIVTATGFLFLSIADAWLAPEIRQATRMALIAVPVVALMRLHEGLLRGVGHVVMAQVPNRAFRPGLFLMFALAAPLVYADFRSGAEAAVLNVLATTLGLLLILGLWFRYRPDPILRVPADPAGHKGLRRALPFALLAGLGIVNTQTDVLMLGFLVRPEDVGFYRIASRVASLVAFAAIAVGGTLAPRIAALHAVGNRAGMQNLSTKAAIATTLVALPMALALVFGGSWVLLLFGEEFQQGATALAILSVGQLINAAMGVGVSLLTMTGHHALLTRTLAVSALLNITLNALLIPPFGASGAAIATAITYLTWNVALALIVRSRLSINATVFSTLTRT